MVAVRSRVDRLVAPTLRRHLLIALGAAAVLLLLSAQIGAYDDYNLTAVAIFAVAAAGLTVPPSAPPDWLGADFPPERWLAWIALAAAVVTMLLLANLLRSAPGRAFKAVRDNEAAAALAGIDVARTQVLAFVISAACAGLAGALFAYWSGITSPAGFSLGLSLQLITAIVIGGLGSLAGAVWGSIVLVFVPLLTSGMASTVHLPSAVADNLPLAIYGGILVIAMLVAPHGIQGALRRILAIGRARWEYPPRGGQKGVVDWDDPAPGT